MFSRAMTRRILTRCSDPGNDRLGRELEPGGEVDARLVAEQLARRGDIGPGIPDISGPRRLELLLDRLAENDADRLCDVIDAGGRARRDVERASARARRVRRARRCVDDVADVGEVARLLA